MITSKMAQLTVAQAELARRLVEDEKVFRFEHATLSSGLSTPFMLDLRGLSTETLTAIVKHIRTIATQHGLSFTHVAGVPTGANALAEHVTRRYQETKLVRLVKDGGRMWIDEEFNFFVGDRVLVIEDVLTTGKNTLAAVHALAIYDLTIAAIIAVCDREQGGRVACEMRGYPAMALFTARELLAVARHTLVATEEEYQEAIAYLAK